MRFITFFIFLIQNTFLLGQVHTSGSFEFDVISVKSTNEDPVNPFIKDMIMENMGNEMKFSIAFAENLISLGRLDFSDEMTYSTYDFTSKKVYTFIESFGEKSFTADPIPELPDIYFLDITDFGKPTPIKKFGLNCSKYTVQKEEVELTFIMTNDIKINKLEGIGHFPEKYGAMVETTIAGMFPDVSITFGMTSFSPTIDNPSLLKIDTIGIENKTDFRDAVMHMFEEVIEEEKIEFQEYGKYDPSAHQNGLLEKFVTMEVMDTSDWTISQAIKQNSLYDLPSLLLDIKRHKKGLTQMNRSQVLAILEKGDLLAPSMADLLTASEAEWNKIPKDLHYLSICLASIKDHLNSSNTRGQIFDNLISMKYLSEDVEDQRQAYINGDLALEELLNNVNTLTQIEQGVVVGDEVIYQKIQSFFEIAFAQQKLDLKIQRIENIVEIKCGEHTYELDINDLKMQDYDKSNYETEPPRIVYIDSIEINKSFYDGFINIVKQIGADQSTGFAFGIYHLNPPFVYAIDAYDYTTITKAYPKLAIEIDALYYIQFPKEDYDSFANVGSSFPYHPSSSTNEVHIGNFLMGDVDAGVDYLSTPQKLKFIAYLKKNHQSFGIDQESLEQSISQIERNLISGTDDLLRHLPNIKITVKKTFDILPKSMYNPRFSSEKNDFKDAYYALHRVFRDDFKASNFSYDEANHKVHFTFNGLAQTVDPGDNNMLQFIRDNMKNSTSGKQIYPVSMFSLTEELYYYLSPDQKNELQKLIPLEF